MGAKARLRIWALIDFLDDHAEADAPAALPAAISDAVVECGRRFQGLMGDDQVLRVLARPKTADASVVSASVDLFGVTVGPGDDSEGRLRPVRAVVTLADRFEFAAYLMPDEDRRVAEYLKMGARGGA